MSANTGLMGNSFQMLVLTITDQFRGHGTTSGKTLFHIFGTGLVTTPHIRDGNAAVD
jgi:hypothetical protein